MTVPDLIHRNSVRLSSISCLTEDSVDSITITTPLDASPPPPPSNTFSIINIVNDDPFPNPKSYPAIAATYTTRRRRAQTSPRPVPSSIMISNNIPQEQPVMIYDTTNNSQVSNTTPSSKPSKFWPRIKRMIMSTNNSNNNNNNSTDKMKQLFESMNISNNDEKSEIKLQEHRINKRWLGKNRARVGPQR